MEKGIIEAKRKEPRPYDVRLENGGQIRRNRQDLKHTRSEPVRFDDLACFSDSESDSETGSLVNHGPMWQEESPSPLQKLTRQKRQPAYLSDFHCDLEHSWSDILARTMTVLLPKKERKKRGM